MGFEFKLSDRELPASPVFVSFLAQVLQGPPFDSEIWAEQRSESLSANHIDPATINKAAAVVVGNPWGRERLARAYSLLVSLLAGELGAVNELHSRFHFVNFIGIPRTGGSYLTAELYRALGMVPSHVPSGIAHDSFPEAGPFHMQPGINSWMISLKTMAEYLTMVETFFKDQKQHFGKIVVPKKLTKAAYAGSFFDRALGEGTQHVVTVRHPVASCVSTYDKSGGLPGDGRFAVRSNIEQWCRRDLQHVGWSAEELNGMEYFDVYLRYWEHYHLSLAMTGLSASRNLKVIAFGKSDLEATAQGFYDLYGSHLHASEFQSSDRARRLHPEWIDQARPGIERIAATWKLAGIAFPAEKIGECW